MIGIGISGADVSLLSTVARWFARKRGLMSGIIKIGAGAGMLVIVPLANWVVSNYGWRTTYTTMGLVTLILIVAAAQFLKRDPGQMGLLPDGDRVQEESPVFQTTGFSFREAIRTRQFWMLSAIYFLFVYCARALTVHIYAHAVDLGISGAIAASLIAFVGGFSIPGRLIMGSLGDKIGYKHATIVTFTLITAAFVWLPLANEVWMLYLFSAIYGIGFGGMYTLISPMVADLFGLGSHGVIFGTVFLSGSIGGAIGPVIMGLIFDISGSYQIGFLLLVTASAIAIVLATLISKPRITS